VAERAGFEPAVPFDTHDFQSCTFGHSVISPGLKRSARRDGGAAVALPLRSLVRPRGRAGARRVLPSRRSGPAIVRVEAICGERGIRTPGTLAGTPDFESGAFDQLCHLSKGPVRLDGHRHEFLEGVRSAAKNRRSRAAHSSLSTPSTTCTRWFSRGSSSMRYRVRTAPAFGLGQPKTRR
jgi:hypothetical protein